MILTEIQTMIIQINRQHSYVAINIMKERKYRHNIEYLRVKPFRALEESSKKVMREPGRRPRSGRNSQEEGRTCSKTLGAGPGMGK